MNDIDKIPTRTGRKDNKWVDEKLNNRGIVRVGDYVNSATKIEWKCLTCNNIWNGMPQNVIHNKTGCPTCKGSKKYTIEFIRGFLSDKNLILIDCVYYNANKSLNIKCGKCDYIFRNSFSNIKSQDHGCPKCAGLNSMTNLEIDLVLNSEKRNILRLESTNGDTHKIKWECNKCDHEWVATPRSVITMNSTCPCCGMLGTSRKENAWLDAMGIPSEYRRYKTNVKNKKHFIRVDGFNPETKTCYEFYGDFWHGNPGRYVSTEMNVVAKKTYQQLYEETVSREDKLRKAGYNIISIWETEWNKGVINGM